MGGDLEINCIACNISGTFRNDDHASTGKCPC